MIDFVAGPERRRTDSDAFRKWFGNSKVVDADGKPLVLYHGTDADFQGFGVEHLGSATDANSAKMGFFFSDRSKTAEYYSTLSNKEREFQKKIARITGRDFVDSGANVIPVYLSLKNPLVHDFKGRVHRSTAYYDLLRKAQAEGRDGAIFRRTYDAGEYGRFDAIMRGRLKSETVFVAFRPEQIKSIFNQGTWDASSPYMLREDAANPIDPRKAEALESIFVGALDGVNVKAATDRDLFRSIILPLRDAGMTREEVAEMTPYLESFLANLRAGRVGLATEPAPRAIEADDRAAVQAKADRIKPVAADEANIRATLPLLLPEQQDDVLKVERRFSKPDGHGMMITNGTGTGKTFSGGGVIKRFVQMGKGDILIVAPSEAVIAGWTKALSALDVPVNQLRDTKDAGQAVTITTYANLRDNDALASRSFDLVVTDESQNLMSSQDGAVTGALQNLRAITHRPADLWRKSRMRHAKEWEAYKAMRDGEAKTAVYRRLKSREEAEVARWAQEPRSKVLFLSATPFAYDKAVDYAEGYLFDYPKDGHVGRSRQSGQNLFMVQHFGYRIRYHKLTKPEAAVDSAVFEREFHEKLKRDGVLSGRSLQVDVDYDRKFVLAADGLGTQIDAVLKHVFEGRRNADKAIADGYQTLEREISQKFNYLKRMQLLEAIKARAAIPDIEKHLALGRKVVVFHDYNVGGGFNPFSNIAPANDANAIAAAADLMAAFPDLNRMKFASYAAPVDALLSALGKRARAFNGTVPQKKRLQNLADFNTDGSGADVLVVQSDAGGAGISMHDLTGTHQRVLINLGMPTKPTTTLQEEGRILRVGTVTNAPFRYYTIGTAWERRAFATRIAERSGTVENLALGNEARDLLTGFIEAYEAAEALEPGPDDGKGGKERDRKANVTSPFEKAKTHYFGRTKTTGRRDQRDGIDFYPTPEPLALKMVEWAGIRPNERVLEPSAGDGAIARYVPDFADLTMVEPSSDLSSRALLKAPHGKTVESTFESYHLVNKAHVIVMNPPFGSGGATAMQHLAKAAKHLRAGGRIVALIPTGPSADKRFDAWWEGDDAKGLSLSAEVALPAVAFERAGTSVMTRVVVIDKPAEGQEVAPDTQRLNFAGARSINEFFDRLEQYDVRRRPDPVRDVVEEMEAEGQDATAPMPQPVQGPPLAAKADAFKLAQVKHAKTGADLFVATIRDKVEREEYAAVLAVAKQHGGYYSSFRGNGAVPGFQFKSEADRQAFLDDMQKPTAGFAETAYHGTPHDFDRFSLDAMGTGEGAQAYGWGLYFAGKRAVSEWYRDKLSRVSLRIDGEEIPPFLYGPQSSDIMQRTQEYLADKPPSRPEGVSEEAWRDGAVLFRISLRAVIGNLRDKINSTPGDDVQDRLRVYRETKLAQYKAAEQRAFPPDMAEYAAHLAAIDWLAARVTKVNPGRLFTVDIPGQESLLDWDAPLSEQPAAVQAIIGAMDAAPDKSVWDATTGQDFIDQLTVDAMGDAAFMQSTRERAAAKAEARRMASEALRAAGIPGHRYLDGSSRNAGEGSYNYVIYDDQAITILEKQQRAQMVREAATSTEEIIRLMPRLRAELDRLDLKRVRLVADSDARDWQGMFHVTGDGALEIVIGASMDPMGTLHHEVIHALRTMNLFTPEEWRALELAAERGWVAKHDIAARYPDLLPHEQIEEAIAEEFSEALAARKSPKGSALVTAFNKIARLLRALRNVLNGAGYQTAEDIFGRILAGEISKRQAGNTGMRASKLAQAPKPNVDAFEAALKHDLGLRSLSLFVTRSGDLKLNMLAVGKDEQGQGIGTKAMSRIAEFADQNGFRLILSPGLRDDGFGTTSRDRLVNFYKRFGFVENKGRRKDFSISEGMYRDPARNRFQRPQAVRPLSAQARAHRNTGMGGALFIPDRRVWEELTRATAPIWARLRNGAGGMSDGIDRARVYIQDRFLPVLRAQEAIERATGRRLPPEQRAYTAETTFSGKVGRHLFEVDEDFVKPIIRLIAASKGRLTAEAVGEWLYARHAIERNAKIASINPAMPDGGSGMTNAEAKQILADAAASPDAARLVEIGSLIDKLRERTLSLREDAGLITHDEASDWRKMYRHYVPLKGFAETDHAEAVLDITGIGKRFNVRGGESRRALGRKSEAFNPLQAAFTQAQEVAIRAEKNRVGQSLHELAKDYPSKALWEVKKPAQKRYFNRSTGLVETRVEDPVSMILAPNEMAVKISGEEHRIIFHDERLARAAGTVGADQMGQITRLLSMFSRFWSMTRTMLNPEFAVANAFRDFQTAQFNIQAFGEGDKGAIAKAMLRDWRKALSGSWRAQGNRYDSVWAKHYREFQKAGAQVSFWTIEQPETAKEDLDRRVRLASGTMAARALKRLTSPRAILSMRDNPALAMIERANIAVDNAIRLAAFVEARKRGWAVEDAAFLAKELTVNFNRRGEVGANMNALYPFFNAAVQGSVRTIKALTSRRVALMALTSIAAGMLNDLLNAWLSDEDDDGQLFYDKVPEYRNERNFHIVGWGTGQNPAAVPMPYGYNIFPYAGQNLGKVVRGVKSPSEAMGDVAAALFNAFSPVNGGSSTTFVSPFFTDPLIEMGENADWTGTPIYPRYPAVGAPDSEVYFAGASEASKAIASFLNSATGGDFREAGWISVSPETIDHLSAFVTGSAGAFVGRTSDLLAKTLKGDVADIGMRDIPILRTLTSPVGPWIDRDQFYSAKAAVQDANADVKAYAGAGQAIPPEKQAMADLYDDMLEAEREMNGKGDWNQSKAGAIPQRPDAVVMKEFNRKYLVVIGKVKP